MEPPPKTLVELRAELVQLSAERLACQQQLETLPIGPGYHKASTPLKSRLLEIEVARPAIQQKIKTLVLASQTTLL